MELEFDPARLPEGFPFATVPELDDFFNFVERVGPRNLPEEARETMQRWFPDLVTFLETHTGDGGGGDGGGGGGEGEGEEEAGAGEAEAERR